MNEPSTAWCSALTVTERAPQLRATRRGTPDHVPNAELAARLLERWRSQPPFRTGPYFEQRCATDGLTADEFLDLLGTPAEALNGRCPAPPDWWVELTRAFARPTPTDVPALPLPETPRGKELAGFLAFVAPLLEQAREHLRAGLQALSAACPSPPFDPGTVEPALLRNLPGQLLMLISRTLTLEVNVARVQGLLPGDTPEQRFQSFLRRLRQREVALALLEEYPVLARQLMTRVENWLTFSLEFLRHLAADWEAVRATFSPAEDPGVLVQINAGVGDKHRGGRSVLLAKFRSGFQVVYKPRALAADVHFQELLDWLNARGDHPPFQTLKVLDRGTYGWVQFVTAHGCTCADEVRHFYERQGGYLALLYALEATDFHYENLIASGEHPMLIDLESLFHPRAGGMDLTQSDQRAGQEMAYSVLRVGLLPQRIWSNAESEGIIINAVGPVEGQMSPHGVPTWDAVGTDEMRFIRKPMPLPGAQNHPTLQGAPVEVPDHAEAIVQGFTSVYRLLLKHRGELLSETGPLACFAQDEVRVILRPTRAYGLLLQESFHPDVLRDALQRDRLLDRLWAAVEQRPYLARVIAAERRDLLRGDVPLFTTRPTSRDLWTSADERIADFLDEPVMTQVRRRLGQLGELDLRQQLWFIRASLATLARNEAPAPKPGYYLDEPRAAADRVRLLAAARAAGDQLETLALRGEQDVSWIGLTATPGRSWVVTPLGTDLYGGLPGVALFLAYLGAVTGETRYTALAQAAARTLRRQMERSRTSLTAVGGFSGWGGVLYTLTHLSALWDDPSLLAEAEQVVELLPPLIERDEYLDVIGGSAGCLGSLLSLYRHAPSERTLAAAVCCGERLLARAQPMPQGIGWPTRVSGATPLTGFSHGAAGMAWALGGLAALTGAERFRAAAWAGIAYERSHYSRAARNWIDLRDQESMGRTAKNGQEPFVTAWCHGAPGIGLARLQSLPYLEDGETRGEIDVALQTTLTQGFGGNQSLCHGNLGNLELLLQAGPALGDPQWPVQVNRLAAMILESIERDGWKCGNPAGVESPGLMTGLAGIGYGLLRLAEPALVPPVVVLAPPTVAPPAAP